MGKVIKKHVSGSKRKCIFYSEQCISNVKIKTPNKLW